MSPHPGKSSSDKTQSIAVVAGGKAIIHNSYTLKAEYLIVTIIIYRIIILLFDKHVRSNGLLINNVFFFKSIRLRNKKI